MKRLLISKNEKAKLDRMAEELMIISQNKKEALLRAKIRLFGKPYDQIQVIAF